MRRFTRKITSKRLLIAFFISLLAVIRLAGQCVPEPLVTNSIEGYLVFGWKDHYRLLDDGKVQLLDVHNQKRVIAAADVGGDGHFQIKQVKPGKYMLTARENGLIPAYVELAVRKKRRNNHAEPVLLIVLGADINSECGGSSITLHSREDLKRIITEARPAHD